MTVFLITREGENARYKLTTERIRKPALDGWWDRSFYFMSVFLIMPKGEDGKGQLPTERALDPLWMAIGPDGQHAQGRILQSEQGAHSVWPTAHRLSFREERKKIVNARVRCLFLPIGPHAPTFPLQSQARGELGILAGIPTGGRPDGVVGDESHASVQPERR